MLPESPHGFQIALWACLYLSAVIKCNPLPITANESQAIDRIRARQGGQLCVKDSAYQALEQFGSNSTLFCNAYLSDSGPDVGDLNKDDSEDNKAAVKLPGMAIVYSTITVALVTLTSVEIEYHTATLTFDLIDRPGPGPATAAATSTSSVIDPVSGLSTFIPTPTPAPTSGPRHGGRIRRQNAPYSNSTDFSGFAPAELSSACNCQVSGIPLIQQEFVVMTVTVAETVLTVVRVELATGGPVIVYATVF